MFIVIHIRLFLTNSFLKMDNSKNRENPTVNIKSSKSLKRYNLAVTSQNMRKSMLLPNFNDSQYDNLNLSRAKKIVKIFGIIRRQSFLQVFDIHKLLEKSANL